MAPTGVYRTFFIFPLSSHQQKSETSLDNGLFQTSEWGWEGWCHRNSFHLLFLKKGHLVEGEGSSGVGPYFGCANRTPVPIFRPLSFVKRSGTLSSPWVYKYGGMVYRKGETQRYHDVNNKKINFSSCNSPLTWTWPSVVLDIWVRRTSNFLLFFFRKENELWTIIVRTPLFIGTSFC